MSITVGRFTFEGPFTDTRNLRNTSGVYCILDAVGGRNNVVDIGESADVRARVNGHDRKACWSRNSRGTLMVAAFYTGATDRFLVEQELRRLFNPPCGIR